MRIFDLENVKNYYKQVYSIIEKFLYKKLKEAKKAAPETYYFINKIKDLVLKNKKTYKILIIPYFFYKALGGTEDNKFFKLSAALFLEEYFYLVHSFTNWKIGKSNPFVEDLYKKYKNDKTKKDPWHIAFSQSLILGDIISGFGYELIVNSGFSDWQKIKILEEFNSVVMENQLIRLEEINKKNKTNFISTHFMTMPVFCFDYNYKESYVLIDSLANFLKKAYENKNNLDILEKNKFSFFEILNKANLTKERKMLFNKIWEYLV